MNRQKMLILVTIIVLFAVVFIIKRNDSEYDYDVTQGFELYIEESVSKSELINSGYPTMINIGASDCVSCKRMEPELIDANRILMDKAKIKFLDHLKFKDLTSEFDLSVVPTQFFYDEDGELYKINKGSLKLNDILDIFKEMGYDFNE